MMKKNGQVSSGKTDFILGFNVVNLEGLVSGEGYRNYLINKSLFHFQFSSVRSKIYIRNSHNFYTHINSLKLRKYDENKQKKKN